jgi:hypothetical protein
MLRRAVSFCARIWPCVALLGTLVPTCSAGSQDVFALVNGSVQDIGALTWTISNTNQGNANYPSYFESATFQLNNTYKYLMMDPSCQFRVFQVITYDDEPAKFPNGNTVTVPYVDPVSGGYDYQQANGGADTAPFYENDDGPNKYSYPRYSDKYSDYFTKFPFPANTLVHSAALGNVTTWDQPGLSGANHVTDFQTYVAFNDPGLEGNKTLDLLAGFSWSVSTNGASQISMNGGNSIDMSVDGLSATIDTALSNANFSGWSWTQYSASNIDLGLQAAQYCPEPSSILLLTFGVGIVAIKFRPRAGARTKRPEC